MAIQETLVHGSTAGHHVVQFFDTPQSCAETVADFVTDGLAADDIVLVVARADAWANVAAHLGAGGGEIDRAVRERQLIVLDAKTTLSKFTSQSWPDRGRFDAVVGGLVRELATRGRLRIYGEMVDILATEAQFRAAVALEDLWNELGKTTQFSLFCGYSAVNFGPERNREALQQICHCHSATRVADDDDLAVWLLSRQDSGEAALPS